MPVATHTLTLSAARAVAGESTIKVLASTGRSGSMEPPKTGTPTNVSKQGCSGCACSHAAMTLASGTLAHAEPSCVALLLTGLARALRGRMAEGRRVSPSMTVEWMRQLRAE